MSVPTIAMLTICLVDQENKHLVIVRMLGSLQASERQFGWVTVENTWKLLLIIILHPRWTRSLSLLHIHVKHKLLRNYQIGHAFMVLPGSYTWWYGWAKYFLYYPLHFFEFLVLSFMLTISLISFYSLMNNVFWPHIDDFIVIYLNDNIIYNKSLEEHIFEKLRENKLYLKREKCMFIEYGVPFPSYFTEKAMFQWTNKKWKLWWLGQCWSKLVNCGPSWYWPIITRDSSKLLSPVSVFDKLVRKNRLWKRTSNCVNTFIKRKSIMSEEPCLNFSTSQGILKLKQMPQTWSLEECSCMISFLWE